MYEFSLEVFILKTEGHLTHSERISKLHSCMFVFCVIVQTLSQQQQFVS